MEDRQKKLRTDCWDKALDSFGYSYIYSKKIESLNFQLRWTKVLGILIPVLLGGILTSYYSYEIILELAIYITTPIALIQLLLSAYLTIIGADEKVNTYSTKSAEYSLLNSEFEYLGKYPPENVSLFQNKMDILLERERGISKGNFDIEDKELRMGMRAGLRNYRRGCAGCGETPISMTPTDCEICGNY
ncbi:mobilome CxxCx(11)CxxC protein [Cyclobacterium salsum]|uniref:mobilome CxxCx(11)CxxC protein n=1 Tax=Cyclobacterium salsum TaxID=2666329 RepID=UPI001390C3CB|nr:mobilome CxxCx(11)CxxC protein [Cyclobacterium salsum]